MVVYPNFTIETKDGILIKIVVKPNSKTKEMQVDSETGKLFILLKSPPDKGKANKELLKFLSEIFMIPSSNIILASGLTSRDKTIIIQNFTAKEIQEKIENLHKHKL